MNKSIRKKPLILSFMLMALLFTMVMDAQAQRNRLFRGFWQTSEEYDETAKIHVGIYLASNTSIYAMEKNQGWDTLGVVPESDPNIGNFRSISSKNGIGLGLGLPLDYRINSRLNISMAPGFLLFEGHGLTYTGTGPQGSTIRHQKVDENSTYNFSRFELPMHLKVRSDHKYLGTSKNSYKLYMLGGMKYSSHIGAKGYYEGKNVTGEQFDPTSSNVPLIVKYDFFSYEMGLGFDIYFTYFKLSPEIRFSQSIGNLLDKNHTYANPSDYPNPFVNALDRLRLRSFQFSLIFE